MIKIASVSLAGGSNTTIAFSSIPSTYAHLFIVLSARSNAAASVYDSVAMSMNGTSLVPFTWLQGSGTTVNTVNSGSSYIAQIPATTTTSGIFGSTFITIPNYTSTGNKVVSSESVNEENSSAANQTIFQQTWTGSAAINAISLTCNVGPFSQYSYATLYGINNGSGGATVTVA